MVPIPTLSSSVVNNTSYRRRKGRTMRNNSNALLLSSLALLLWVVIGTSAFSPSTFAASSNMSSPTASVSKMTSTRTKSSIINNNSNNNINNNNNGVPQQQRKGSKSKTLLKASSVSEDIASIANGISTDDDNNDDGIIPITIISGFLGSGKTTLLQHILENKQGDCPVGVIVNDVADVNIDAKLVNSMESNSADGLIELENGCACCALSDELLAGVSELVTLSDLRRSNNNNNNNKDDDAPNGHLKPFKHIVVEMSGVSDPRNIRATFQEAEMNGMPLMSRIKLDTMVTVVDAEMFESYFQSEKVASRDQSPELFREADDFEMEDWMEDMPIDMLRALLGHRGVGDDASNGVADLLVGQTETADVILLNKCDLLNDDNKNENDGTTDDDNTDINPKLKRLRELVKALNPRPTTSVLESSYGKVPLTSILAVANGEGVALSGAVDDHREFVDAASSSKDALKAATAVAAAGDGNAAVSTPSAAPEVAVAAAGDAVTQALTEDGGCTDPDCSECGDGATTIEATNPEPTTAVVDAATSSGCTDPSCSDPDCGAEVSDSHQHEHSHGHEDSAEAVAETESVATIGGGCTDPSCSDPDCGSEVSGSDDHEHSHGHSAEVSEEVCNDPGCTEDHDHSHSHSAEVSEDVCNDPGCTEDHDHSSHSHSAHSHNHEENSTHAGIGTFVYRARRPFHPKRMLSFLRTMPIVRGIPTEGSDDDDDDIENNNNDESAFLLNDATDATSTTTTLSTVLRSKGFVWCADSHSNSMYWSHAGSSFEYKCLGRWWATLPRNQWPEGVDEYVLRDFDDVHHPSEGEVSLQSMPESVGDRRQEIVFIGLGFGQASKQRDIRETLDKCLLSEEEYNDYQSICLKHATDDEDPDKVLQGRFPAAIESEYMNY